MAVVFFGNTTATSQYNITSSSSHLLHHSSHSLLLPRSQRYYGSASTSSRSRTRPAASIYDSHIVVRIHSSHTPRSKVHMRHTTLFPPCRNFWPRYVETHNIIDYLPMCCNRRRCRKSRRIPRRRICAAFQRMSWSNWTRAAERCRRWALPAHSLAWSRCYFNWRFVFDMFLIRYSYPSHLLHFYRKSLRNPSRAQHLSVQWNAPGYSVEQHFHCRSHETKPDSAHLTNSLR